MRVTRISSSIPKRTKQRGGSVTSNVTTIVSISPTTGSTEGGQVVTITVTGASGSPAVTIGGSAATSVTVVSPTSITCITPSHASGAVDVVAGGQTLAGAFTYAAAPGFFVSTTGLAANLGTSASPWSLSHALTGAGGAITAGSTVWLKGGTYSGSFTCALSGTTSLPIVFRQVVGEKAIIDSTANDGTATLLVSGNYTHWWQIETTCSNTARISTQTTGDLSHPSDIPRQSKGIRCTGHDNKFIACVAHDGGNGFADQAEATAYNNEWHDGIAFNNGWIGTDRGHGHNTYIQNLTGTKLFKNCAFFDSFDDNFNLFTQSGHLLSIHATGNAIFNGGGPAVPTFDYRRNVGVVAGADTVGDVNFDSNSIFHIDGNKEGFLYGTNGDLGAVSSFSFINNIVQGSNEVNDWPDGSAMTGNMFASGTTPFTGLGHRMLLVRIPTGESHVNFTWDDNDYSYVPSVPQPNFFHLREGGVGTNYATLAALQAATGWETNGSYITTAFPGSTVRYRPSDHIVGRGFIHVWNWNAASAVGVNPSTILTSGDQYRIRHVYDWDGSRSLTSYAGTYNGSVITLDMANWTAPTPIGLGSPPASTAPYFNVFLVEKTG